MKKMTCVVVVPIYKEYDSLDLYEKSSLKRLMSVCTSRDVTFVTYAELDIARYIEQLVVSSSNRSIRVETFDKSYFISTSTYNELMLSKYFYKRFRLYDYMLIYQLDAYVFEDRLDYWMAKGYDYVGAPWFANYGDHESGDDLWEVGNGGLSLRKVEFYYNLLTYRGVLYQDINLKQGLYEFVKSIAKSIGYHNTISWHIKHLKGALNEDCFLTYYLKKITNKPRFIPSIPSPKEAIAFAFEKSPSYLYELNGRQLPMGCHAFMKYEYDTFWSKYIV